MNKLLTKRETAALLRISLNTLNLWICKRKIPFLKLGRGKKSRVRFNVEEIENWLKNIQRENSNKRET